MTEACVQFWDEEFQHTDPATLKVSHLFETTAEGDFKGLTWRVVHEKDISGIVSLHWVEEKINPGSCSKEHLVHIKTLHPGESSEHRVTCPSGREIRVRFSHEPLLKTINFQNLEKRKNVFREVMI